MYRECVKQPGHVILSENCLRENLVDKRPWKLTLNSENALFLMSGLYLLVQYTQISSEYVDLHAKRILILDTRVWFSTTKLTIIRIMSESYQGHVTSPGVPQEFLKSSSWSTWSLVRVQWGPFGVHFGSSRGSVVGFMANLVGEVWAKSNQMCVYSSVQIKALRSSVMLWNDLLSLLSKRMKKDSKNLVHLLII